MREVIFETSVTIHARHNTPLRRCDVSSSRFISAAEGDNFVVGEMFGPE